ncbi:MAG: prenyltransferase/squalene oxidase repeat-containing protein [Planctomycetota bacterium]
MRRIGLVCLFAIAAAGQDRETRTPPREPTRRAAIARGLSYLARQQKRDGAFGRSESGTVGISALCLLAYMAGGHQENRGPYGEALRSGVNFLLKSSLPAGRRHPAYSAIHGKPTGYIYVPGDSDSRMHGHGYATQVLVLSYGTGRRGDGRSRELRRKIQLAVRVIEQSQTVTGGWGYEPSAAAFHEGSVTVTVVQALRLARDAGFLVDREVVERGLKYLHLSQTRNGAFRYRLTSESTTEALTAAAITAMHGFGEYYTSSIRRGLSHLREGYAHPERLAWTLYANYYAAQAFYRAGGDHWRFWKARIVPLIVRRQEEDGSWDDRLLRHARARHGRTFATAFSVLALSVEDGYLPLFQR